MADRSNRRGRGLGVPYGLAVPVNREDSSEKQDDGEDYRLRCPSCGKKISWLSKWWDTAMAWYSDSYRLIRCRKCGTWFAARRKRSTTNKTWAVFNHLLWEYMEKRSHKKKVFCGILVSIQMACGGEGSIELTVVNTLQSADIIRIDLAGDTRQLNIGDFTVFRSVSLGTNILSVEGLSCAGTIRDTLNVTADSTVRYLVSRNSNTGECESLSTLTMPRPVNPVGR